MKAACTYIDATIFVDRPSQKAIVIGEKGVKLKKSVWMRVSTWKNVRTENHADPLGES